MSKLELELKQYRAYLDDLLNKKSNIIFTNGGIAHAEVALSTLFNNAEKEILIYSNGLNPKGVAGRPDYKNALLKYVDSAQKPKLRILLNSEEFAHESPLCEILQRVENSCDVIVKIISENAKDAMFSQAKYLKNCNFSVYDQKMIRIEVAPDEYRAIGSFNQPATANQLRNLFCAAFDDSEVLKV